MATDFLVRAVIVATGRAVSVSCNGAVFNGAVYTLM